MIKTKTEVDDFLNEFQNGDVKTDNVIINDVPWKRKVNKTRAYLAETGLRVEDVFEVIKRLKVENYSYTELDSNKNFAEEEVWFFGITENLVDREENYYIKLKIRKDDEVIRLIMSFHPESPNEPDEKLEFPYKKY